MSLNFDFAVATFESTFGWWMVAVRKRTRRLAWGDEDGRSDYGQMSAILIESTKDGDCKEKQMALRVADIHRNVEDQLFERFYFLN
jgi:hypothetical protein